MGETYPRDLVGYGPTPPNAKWPGGARLALNFVLNWEEGGESSVLHGDSMSEAAVNDAAGALAVADRQLTVESMFEYGSRSGVWRLVRMFQRYDIPLTIFAVGMAVERYPEAVRGFHALGHEICAHGYRWLDYQSVSEDVERAHIRWSIRAIEEATGERPLGWYTGRTSPRTRQLVVEEGGFLYDSDAYNDDLPYWVEVGCRNHLVLPYSFDANDMRFSTVPGFDSGSAFTEYLCDTFDQLYEEGAEQPKMMSVGLHCRLSGRPGRAIALRRFLDHVAAHEQVWVTRRIDIARHWMAVHPTPGQRTATR